MWARRITTEREARGWNKPQFIEALRAHTSKVLPGKESLLRRVHSWESGATCPDDFYQPLIAKTFGTVTAAIWPVPGSRDADAELIAGTGMDTLEVLTRLRASSVNSATMDGLRITVDRLCSEYPHLPAQQLLLEDRSWLRRITTMLDRQLTLAQHQELLSLAGWLAGLVGCVEYDSANRAAAEADPAGSLEPRRGIRQHRGHGLGTGNAGLVRPHPRRLPRRAGGRHRSRRRPERRGSRAAARPESQSLGPDRRPAPGRSRP